MLAVEEAVLMELDMLLVVGVLLLGMAEVVLVEEEVRSQLPLTAS